jgi:GT2 family glycosyltransferase
VIGLPVALVNDQCLSITGGKEDPMVVTDKDVRDYIETILGDTEESQFLRSFPWHSGAHPQTPEQLGRSLVSEASRLVELPDQVSFSLIVPLWNTRPFWLWQLILSVRCQSWFDWELIVVDDGSGTAEHLQAVGKWAGRDGRIHLVRGDSAGGIADAKNRGIEHSSGRFVCLVGPTDVIHPSALGIFARRLNAGRETNLIFSNEARVDETSSHVGGYLSKPPFDLFTLLRSNYIGRLTVIRRDLVFSARRGETALRARFDGVEEHDLLLRIALSGEVNPDHVPLGLYYVRTSSDSMSAIHESTAELIAKRLALLDEFVPEVYPGARWQTLPPAGERGNLFPTIHITALAGQKRPSLLVMVPFKDNLALTLKCVQSLERQEHDLDVEVTLINNRSEDLAAGCELLRWLDQPRRNRYRVVDYDAPFNFARLHNFIVAREGRQKDLLLFLNNDAELVSPDCLQTMALQLLADERCGFAGIKLDYPEGQGVQHGGVQVHDHATSHGYAQIIHANEPRQFIHEDRISFGVTFACAMTRRAVFERLGGLDEILLPNAYGDVDINTRALEMGYRNYYFGTLIGTHHETKTRGRLYEEGDHVALQERHGQTISFWRPRSFARAPEIWPPAIEPEPVAIEPAPPREPAEVSIAAGAVPHPLRYKVADRLNQTLKFAIGPAHGALKKSILLSRKPLLRRRDPSRSG